MIALAMLLIGGGLLMCVSRRVGPTPSTTTAIRAAGPVRGRSASTGPQLVLRAALAGLVGGSLALMAGLPLPVALVAGTLVGAAVRARRRDRRDRQGPQALRSLALTLDLIASAITAGLPADRAIATVARCAADVSNRSVSEAIQPLERVARLIQWGADPAEAWRSLESVQGYGFLAVTGRRCADSGARLAGSLVSTAADLRAQRLAAALERAERVGVWSLLPLGLCFLPAFVCLGVLPVVAGLASQLLGSTSG